MSFVSQYLLFAIMLVLLVLMTDAVLRSRLEARIQFDEFDSSNHASLIAYLPGILADGVTSSEPLRKTWSKYGKVLCVSYGTQRFSGRKAAFKMSRRLFSSLDRHRPDKLVLIQSSMGGILGLDVWQQIRGDDSIPSRVEMIVIDGVQGSENMLGGGNIVAPIVRFLPFGPMFNFILGPLFRGLQVEPKEEDIQGGLNKETVKRDAMKSMAPYQISVWRDQLTYMAGYDSLHPDQFRGISRVTYLLCSKNNETIRQPDEARKWETACRAAGVEFVLVDVPTPHCAYAQQPRIWNEVFHKALTGATIS